MKIYLYITRQLITPFIYSNLTLIMIFLLQFLIRFADRIIGKGLEFFIIVKLIAYNMAWMIALIVPMSILVAILMTFGSLSQNNETIALKSAGASLYKLAIPVLVFAFLIFYLLVEFNNKVYPDANYNARILIQSINAKKPTLALTPGVFLQEINNVAILAKSVDAKTNEMKNITMFDYNDPLVTNIIIAEKGKIYFSSDQQKLIIELESGELHESNNIDNTKYRKMNFEKNKIYLPGEQFSFQQIESSIRGERELGAEQLKEIIDSLKQVAASYEENQKKQFAKYFLTKYTLTVANQNLSKAALYFRSLDHIRISKSIIQNYQDQMNYLERLEKEYEVEYHKKYSIPFACIVFVLIGVPLGVMIRKGGFGPAATTSLIFFVIYWAFLIAGEKLAEREFTSPFLGMWAANIFLGTLGIYMFSKAAKETPYIDITPVKRFLSKKLKLFYEEENEN